MRLFFIIVGLSLSVGPLKAQKSDMYADMADKAFAKANYKDAQNYYEQAIALRPKDKWRYNLGNIALAKDQSDDAKKHWLQAGKSEDPTVRSSAFFNLGNSYMKEQKFDQAIEAYKNALKADPNAEDARRNLAIAQAMNRQENQNQQEKNKQDQENQQQEQQQNQENQQQDQENQQQDQNEDQQQNKTGQQGVDSSETPSLEKLTKQELERLLEVLEQEDKKVQQKAARIKTKTKKTDKAW